MATGAGAASTTPSASDELDAYYNDLEQREGSANLDDGGTGGGDTPAVATSSPAPTPVAVPDLPPETPASDSDTSGAAPATPPAPPDPEAAFWSAIDTNPHLPPSLRGKTRREVYDTNVRALAFSKQAGEQKNEALRRAEVAEAGLAVAREMYSRTATPTPTPAAPPPLPKPAHEQFGLPDRESAYGAVPDIVDQLPGFIEQRATSIADARVKPIEDELAGMRRTSMFEASERARNSIGTEAKIPSDTWDELRMPLASILNANAERLRVGGVTDPAMYWPLDPRNPEAWRTALTAYRKHASSLIPQVVNTPAPPPPAGNRAPAPSAAPAARRPATTGDPKTDAMARDYLSSFNKNLKPGQKPMEFDQLAKTIREDRRRNRVEDEE